MAIKLSSFYQSIYIYINNGKLRNDQVSLRCSAPLLRFYRPPSPTDGEITRKTRNRLRWEEFALSSDPPVRFLDLNNAGDDSMFESLFERFLGFTRCFLSKGLIFSACFNWSGYVATVLSIDFSFLALTRSTLPSLSEKLDFFRVFPPLKGLDYCVVTLLFLPSHLHFNVSSFSCRICWRKTHSLFSCADLVKSYKFFLHYLPHLSLFVRGK